ncbi:MAG: hypothetical protein AMXMBFR4_25240 [Candidatus Hydrogenedentota bacterium]
MVDENALKAHRSAEKGVESGADLHHAELARNRGSRELRGVEPNPELVRGDLFVFNDGTFQEVTHIVQITNYE